ncbi:MAG: tRNA pseudouridine(55) synthase TruB [Gammaproteobacteria bacterium]|nr:tRNA pseudouridine(55) synthase TruB [Gammaproteobacteria bacterium]MCP5202059.1 tRNA pseudouridine(55) synthase TruB [Gammaproteobacteria bacterium]
MARRHGGRKARGRDVSGILLLDKPLGLSSNQALQRVKRLFDARKAGHTGNLDVLATGLLPICFGEATKVCQFLLDADKRYLSDFTFGQRTTTGDAEGEIIAERPTDGLDETAVRRAMAAFDGWIEQLPPMHSAIKQNGQPLYKLAHQGIEVARETRRVRIDRFELLRFERPVAQVAIACSKGTYVRTLAEDLGEALGCGGFVSALRRDGAGPYRLADAYTLEQLEALAAEGGHAALDALLLEQDSALEHLPRVALGDDAAWYFGRGQAVQAPGAPRSGLLRLYDGGGRFLGVGEVLDDGRVSARRLFLHQAPESQGENLRRRA